MSEYYAVQRSDNSLKHYGVKGMKWGVRKALAEGGSRGGKRLARQYNKAAKKLAKLNAKADIKTQQTKVTKYNKEAKRYAKVAGAGLGAMAAGAGAYRLSKLAGAALNSKRADSLNAAASSVDSTAARLHRNAAEHYRDMSDKAWDVEDKLWYAQRSSAVKSVIGGLTAGAVTGAVINKARAAAAKRRTTTKGHAKAVAQRDAWRKEMQSAFKGTQYANLPKQRNKKLDRKEKREKAWADAYRSSIADLKKQNEHTDIYKKRNDKYIAKWNKKLKKHEGRIEAIRRSR